MLRCLSIPFAPGAAALVLALASGLSTGAVDEPTTKAAETPAYGDDLGTVRFPVSCGGAAAARAQRGLALLHHMTYEGARAEFEAATEADPDCAMGYWGQAMTYIHPLWSDPPSQREFAEGKALVKQAKSAERQSDWERAYVDAASAYYRPGRKADEQVNLSRMAEGWRSVHEQFSDDPEAATLYALFHLSTADPEDKRYRKQKRSAEIAEKVLARIPDHPGAHHYIIHAYDYPPLAARALEVAKSYADIAPEVPHALHMPSHIFTRLGHWEESIDMNRRSAAAALKHPAGDAISMHYFHALDYLAYAYLQRGEDEQAREVAGELESLEAPIQPHLASAYALAAIPARLALERKNWEQAASLEVPLESDFPWADFPAMQAIVYFTNAVGAARSGDREAARQALGTLSRLEEKAAESSQYWAKQIGIQRLTAAGWLAHSEGNLQEALRKSGQAARWEGRTEKHPVTPGEVVPAHELHADLLLEQDRYEAALREYEAALARNPGRFNSLYGAGHAAQSLGRSAEAARYYRDLVDVAAADAVREHLYQAKRFLEQSR